MRHSLDTSTTLSALHEESYYFDNFVICDDLCWQALVRLFIESTRVLYVRRTRGVAFAIESFVEK